ncbi:TlpA family protein disulfide reductase [Chitinophagaceae bacterium LWZ2-11]
MKRIAIATFIIAGIASACTSSKKTSYTVSRDADSKILNGVVNRSIIENDTSFAWFKENMKYGTTNPAAIEAFKNNKDKFTIVVFGGTWCHDTQNLLPIFYRLVDKSGYPEKEITLIAVDREKHTTTNLQDKYKVTNVPTFIVYNRAGAEVGRVVEYGKYNEIDKELGEIAAGIK